MEKFKQNRNVDNNDEDNRKLTKVKELSVILITLLGINFELHKFCANLIILAHGKNMTIFNFIGKNYQKIIKHKKQNLFVLTTNIYFIPS